MKKQVTEMKGKWYVVSVLALTGSYAHADTILFPNLVKSSSVVSFVTVINDSSPASYLKYVYRHKGNASFDTACGTSSFVRPTSPQDIVTFDLSGVFNGGAALFNDSGSYGGAFSLPDAAPRRAYLLVTHSNSSGSRTDVGNNRGLKGEVIIMDIATGAAWGYRAINDKNREDYSFTADGTSSALKTGESGSIQFFPTNEWTTKIFVTPIGDDMDTASLAGTVSLDTIYNRGGQAVATGFSRTINCLAVGTISDFLDSSTVSALSETGGWSYFNNEGSNSVAAYKLEYTVNNPAYGGTNNNGYCLSCDPETLAAAGAKSWTISDIPYSSGSSRYSLTLSTNPADRTMSLSVTATQGVPYFFYTDLLFVQASQQFDLDKYRSPSDNDSAQFTPHGGWDGYGQIVAGVTKTGTISEIPSWFNLSAPFTFIYECGYNSCQRVMD